MIKVRFHANAEDPRPVTWPVRHPYWISGEGDGYAIVVAYADDEDYIYRNWPEATELDSQEVQGYVFTDRFPRPEWMPHECGPDCLLDVKYCVATFENYKPLI